MRKRIFMLMALATLAVAMLAGGGALATHVLGVTIDPEGTWDHATDAITVTGTVTCNDGFPNETSVMVTVDQTNNPNKARTATGSAGPFSPCSDPSTTFAWSVTVASTTSFPFTPGFADVTAETDCCDDATNSTSLTANETVLVKGGPS